MNKKSAIAVLKSGKFFSAEFTKKDGSNRKIVGRYGVKKYLSPSQRPQAYNPRELGYLPIFDIQKSEYRLINLQTLTKVNNKLVK